MVDEINVDMGEYQIECDKEKVLWRIADKFDSTVKEFDDLQDLLNWLKRRLETIDTDPKDCATVAIC